MANTIMMTAVGFAFFAVLLLLIKLITGKNVVEKAVAIDTLTIVTISIMSFISYHSGRIIYLDVAMVYALISFIGMIALARYIEGGL